jgi:hypothetical protein
VAPTRATDSTQITIVEMFRLVIMLISLALLI